jgi:hypothetical protein
MRVLSLGWGVQSFTLAAMSALGDLPLLDYAVHADTGYEMAGRMRLRSGGRRGLRSTVSRCARYRRDLIGVCLWPGMECRFLLR